MEKFEPYVEIVDKIQLCSDLFILSENLEAVRDSYQKLRWAAVDLVNQL